MSSADDFMSQFDETGLYRERNGALAVTFTTMGDTRFPGQLHFKDGLCVRAQMQSGSHWGLPDESPLHNIQFLLHLGQQELMGIAIHEGRVTRLEVTPGRSRKRDFLAKFRIARNLFVHPRAEVGHTSTDTNGKAALVRSALWLTPSSVAGFNVADFPELGHDRQQELREAVQNFLAVAKDVPANKAATEQQYDHAVIAFSKMCEILGSYLPIREEAARVEKALQKVEFPPWVVNWDCELGNDPEGTESVWVNVYVDEHAVPKQRLGRETTELTTKIREAFANGEIDRWPYLRLKTALEHKVG